MQFRDPSNRLWVVAEIGSGAVGFRPLSKDDARVVLSFRSDGEHRVALVPTDWVQQQQQMGEWFLNSHEAAW